MKVKDLKEILAKVNDETIIIFDVEGNFTRVCVDIEEAETGCTNESEEFNCVHEGYNDNYQPSTDEKIIVFSFGNWKPRNNG